MILNQPGQLFDIAIIGGGIAGLSVALRLPTSMRVALFTKGILGESNTRYAQGGVAVALGADDSPDLHFQDTIAAGAGLCNEEAVRVLVEQGPSAVRWLIKMGVRFDRAGKEDSAHATPDGLLLGREGAHCRWRVLHAGGDATGAEIERALLAALRKRHTVKVYEETFVSDLLVQQGVCRGLIAIDRDGHSFSCYANRTVLANGGAGGLWLHTSNPTGATADGIALAWRAGAAVADLEFMQFHPTVLVANGVSHLISEAVRGEGAYLRNHAGERFMLRYSPQAELAPRDVVARAILSEMLAEGVEYQYLDLRHLSAEKMYARFPTISSFCLQQGLDMARDLLPIAPAAHYCMGGVLVDTAGNTTLPGLSAVGEVSCTGVHGANRLASNSLLEGLVYGIHLADILAGKRNIDVSNQQSLFKATSFISYSNVVDKDMLSSGITDQLTSQVVREELRRIMWQFVSLSREESGLRQAGQRIKELRAGLEASKALASEDVKSLVRRQETFNMLEVAQLVTVAALHRRESRGSHWRKDYQATSEDLTGQHFAFQRLYIDPYGLAVPREEAVPVCLGRL
jgi:L-aspartate oxidase